MENNNYKEKYESLIEVIKILRDTNPSDEGIQNWIKDFVPELAESEDEKIRKALIGYFSMGANNNETTFNIEDKKILAWLEKQSEHKLAWSEEDEQYLLVCKNALAKYQTTDKWDANIIYNWLKNKLQKL